MLPNISRLADYSYPRYILHPDLIFKVDSTYVRVPAQNGPDFLETVIEILNPTFSRLDAKILQF